MPQGRLPVVVLTGYLGAGKTTLLNYILKEQQHMKLAVIENEIGEVSIDDALVEQKHEDLAEELKVLNNGCVCCTIRGDLVNTLHELLDKVSAGKLNLDGVLIELTGRRPGSCCSIIYGGRILQARVQDRQCHYSR